MQFWAPGSWSRHRIFHSTASMWRSIANRPWGVRLVHVGWPGFVFVHKALVLDLEEVDHKILFSANSGA